MGNWDKPWLIGGGVEHGVETARLLAHIGASGGEGIVSPPDLRVSALASPGPSVSVAKGACVILNRTPGVFAEAYAARLPLADTVAISPTGATARTDMIVARIEDPFQPGTGWPIPPAANLQTTEYAKSAVISNVGSARTVTALGLSFSAIPLAVVVIPVNTTNITQAMVQDLRSLYRVQSAIDKEIVQGTVVNKLTAAAWAQWPNIVFTGASFLVPSWATHYSASVILGNVGAGEPGNNGGIGWGTSGNLRVSLLVGGTTTALGAPTAFAVDSDAGVDRFTLVAGARRIALPVSFQGKTAQLKVEGYKVGGNTDLMFDTKSLASIDIAWHQGAA